MGFDDCKTWDNLHDNDEQIKRLNSAKKAECTPLSINHSDFTGVFSGSSSKYQTSLTSCTCKDFSIKRKPCKHMYRLAIELGLINTDVKSDLSKVQKSVAAKSWNLEHAIEIIETLEPDLQIKLKEIIMPALFKKQYIVPVRKFDGLSVIFEHNLIKEVNQPKIAICVLKRNELIKILDDNNISGFKRNSKKENLIQWIYDNVDILEDIISPYVTCAEISEEFKKSARKAYTHLHHKFDYEEIYDPDEDKFVKVPKQSEQFYTIKLFDGNGLLSDETSKD